MTQLSPEDQGVQYHNVTIESSASPSSDTNVKVSAGLKRDEEREWKGYVKLE